MFTLRKCLFLLSASLIVILGCNFTTNLPFLRPTETPTPTPTFTPTPTLTPTPTPSPTPTPLPIVRVEAGDKALFYGDWDTAQREYTIALESNPDPDVQASALLGISRALMERDETATALNTLRQLVDGHPGVPQLPPAYILLGQVFTRLDRHSEAADAYQTYLELRPGVIDAYVQEWWGDALFDAGDYLEAVNAYTLALSAPQLPSDADIRIKIARSLTALGDYQTALSIYDEVYVQNSDDFTRARVNLLRGGVYTLLGNLEGAHAAYLDSVENYPRIHDSYLGLIELVKAGVPVNELDRGIVDYYAQEYSLAIAAFDRHILSDPNHAGQVHYFKGLALREIDAYQAAIEEWDEVIDQHSPNSPYWDDAWEEKGYTQWAFLDLYDAGIQTFLDFTARVPDHPRAADFLFFAARVSERDGQLQRAAQIWARLADEYPLHHQAFLARFLAGITHFRLQNYPQSLEHFQRASEIATSLGDQAAAAFWMGKATQALGDSEAARAAWENAASIDPTGYYSERARDLLLNRPPFSPPELFDLTVMWEQEQNVAEGWLRGTFSLPDNIDLSSLGPLSSDPRLIRGRELWHLGFYELARAEFEALRLSIQSNPVENYRLANFLVDLGAYRTAIFSGRQVLNLAGMDDAGTMTAPRYFNLIRFGTYYKDLIIPEAQKHNFHPLLIFSLVRQESLFEGFVRSSAGARGLMQIIPATGQGIHANQGWPPGYTSDDLYRPSINVVFGVDYLADQRDLFARSEQDINDRYGITLYAALAAYNGGPGNALIWKELAGDDPDLFAEIVRFSETRLYIRSIYEIFNIYRRIYDRSP